MSANDRLRCCVVAAPERTPAGGVRPKPGAPECYWTKTCAGCGSDNSVQNASDSWFVCDCQRDGVRILDSRHVTYAYSQRASPHLALGGCQLAASPRLSEPALRTTTPRATPPAPYNDRGRTRLISTLIQKAKHDAARQRRRILLRYTDASQHARPCSQGPCNLSACSAFAFPKLTAKPLAVGKSKRQPKMPPHPPHVPRSLCALNKPKLSIIHTRLT